MTQLALQITDEPRHRPKLLGLLPVLPPHLPPLLPRCRFHLHPRCSFHLLPLRRFHFLSFLEGRFSVLLISWLGLWLPSQAFSFHLKVGILITCTAKCFWTRARGARYKSLARNRNGLEQFIV